MSTEVAADAAPKTTTYNLTRGAAYLLEALCQLPDWQKGNRNLDRRVNALWCKLHKHNPPRTDEFDFEKGVLKRKDEDPTEFAARGQLFKDAFQRWQDEPMTLELTKRHQDALLKGLVWGFNNRDKWAHQNNQHVASILDAFGDLLDIESE